MLAREPGRAVFSHATFSWTNVTTSRCFPGSGGAGIQPATRRFRPGGTGTVSCTRLGSCHSWPEFSVASHESPRCTGAGSPLVSVRVDRLLTLTRTDTGCPGRTGPDDPIRLRSLTDRPWSSDSLIGSIAFSPALRRGWPHKLEANQGPMCCRRTSPRFATPTFDASAESTKNALTPLESQPTSVNPDATARSFIADRLAP
jgi:hypothetical protein